MLRLALTGTLFQMLWWVAVLEARHTATGLGPWLLALFAALAIADAARRGAKPGRLLAAWAGAVLVGAVLDSAAIHVGWLDFPAGRPAGWPLPPWMLGLWLGFAALLPGPLAALSKRPALAAALGLLGGPASYAAAVAAGAASFPGGRLPVLLVLGLLWGVGLPLLARLGQALQGDAPCRTFAPGTASPAGGNEPRRTAEASGRRPPSRARANGAGPHGSVSNGKEER